MWSYLTAGHTAGQRGQHGVLSIDTTVAPARPWVGLPLRAETTYHPRSARPPRSSPTGLPTTHVVGRKASRSRAEVQRGRSRSGIWFANTPRSTSADEGNGTTDPTYDPGDGYLRGRQAAHTRPGLQMDSVNGIWTLAYTLPEGLGWSPPTPSRATLGNEPRHFPAVGTATADCATITGRSQPRRDRERSGVHLPTVSARPYRCGTPTSWSRPRTGSTVGTAGGRAVPRHGRYAARIGEALRGSPLVPQDRRLANARGPPSVGRRRPAGPSGQRGV